MRNLCRHDCVCRLHSWPHHHCRVVWRAPVDQFNRWTHTPSSQRSQLIIVPKSIWAHVAELGHRPEKPKGAGKKLQTYCRWAVCTPMINYASLTRLLIRWHIRSTNLLAGKCGWRLCTQSSITKNMLFFLCVYWIWSDHQQDPTKVSRPYRMRYAPVKTNRAGGIYLAKHAHAYLIES